jgi:hypothetical protein
MVSITILERAGMRFLRYRTVSKRSFDVQVYQKKVATARNARVAFGYDSDFQNKSIEVDYSSTIVTN